MLNDKKIGFLADFVPSAILPKLYKVSEKQLSEIFADPSKLDSTSMIYSKPVFDEKNYTLSAKSYTYLNFPKLFGEGSILSKVHFNKELLAQVDNHYLKELEKFLDDLNNEDNLLGSPLPSSYILVERISLPIKNYPGHSEDDQETFYVIIA